MIRLAISVEGPTEEEFVKLVLAEHLRAKGVEPQPVLIGEHGKGDKGGNVTVKRLTSDMAKLYFGGSSAWNPCPDRTGEAVLEGPVLRGADSE